jgi:hypothetical protein
MLENLILGYLLGGERYWYNLIVITEILVTRIELNQNNIPPITLPTWLYIL